MEWQVFGSGSTRHGASTALTTLGDLLQRYASEKLTDRTADDPGTWRIRTLCLHLIAQIKFSALQTGDIAGYRDARCKVVRHATVKKALEPIARIITIARTNWKIHLAANVASGALVRRPASQDGDERDHRLADVQGRHSASPHEIKPNSETRRRCARAEPSARRRQRRQQPRAVASCRSRR